MSITMENQVITRYGYKKISSISKGEKVLSYIDGRLEFVPVIRSMYVGVALIHRIKLKSSKTIKCSSFCEFMTDVGYSFASSLKKGDKLLKIGMTYLGNNRYDVCFSGSHEIKDISKYGVEPVYYLFTENNGGFILKNGVIIR